MIELILGGARSGKSRRAEARITAISQESNLDVNSHEKSRKNTHPAPVYYIATGQAFDNEMHKRIKKHQADRPSHWLLIEEPLDLASAVKNISNEYSNTDINPCIIIDCLTLWLSNCLAENSKVAQSHTTHKNQNLEQWNTRKAHFIQALSDTTSDVVLVSNEVGHGIVPLGELSRSFVDESGWLHQEIARIADRVEFVMAGLPLTLKPQSVQNIEANIDSHNHTRKN